MSHHAALVDGLARFLASEGLGTYSPDGVFLPGERGITVSAEPEVPAELICLAFYMPEYQHLQGRSRRVTSSRIQIRTRILGHPLKTLDLFDALSERLDNKRVQLGNVSATGHFLSATQPTRNSSAAWEQTSNWKFTALEGLTP